MHLGYYLSILENKTMENTDIQELRNLLADKAKQELINNPGSLQVTIFEMVSGEIILLFIFNLDSEKEEECFFNNLKENNKRKINHILTMWNDNTIDMPKRSMLLKAHKLDEYNDNTCVLLSGEDGIRGFRLSSLLK